MAEITRAGEFLAAFSRIKSGAPAFTASYFGTPEDAEAWLEGGTARIREWPGAMLILRRDRDFHHLYHLAAGPGPLREALAAMPAAWTGTVVTADLVGRPHDTEAAVQAYADCGFRPYRSLVRMSRCGAGGTDGTTPAPGDWAGTADVPDIQAFLERTLDRFAEQIPTLAQVRAWAEAGRILLARRDGGVAGVLVFETAGLASTLQYWHVDPSCRGAGVGGRLLRGFLHQCRASRRLTLWVFADNHDSIGKYRHYGFTQDPVSDRILIRCPHGQGVPHEEGA